jgi:hypothetical protein
VCLSAGLAVQSNRKSSWASCNLSDQFNVPALPAVNPSHGQGAYMDEIPCLLYEICNYDNLRLLLKHRNLLT